MRNNILKKSTCKERKICEKAKRQNGITLIALIVTIVVLLILAGVSISMLTGENGLLNKAQTASEETLKQTASEKINLKITNVQIETYAKKQMMPTLQDVADAFYLDKEIEYVITKNEVASTETVKEKIDVTGYNSIYTKLEEYPYEFEIDCSLRLASINGVKIADNNLNSDNSELLERIEALETSNSELLDKVQELENRTSISATIINITTPNVLTTWTKVADYPTGYNKDNTIISGHIYVDSTQENIVIPFASPDSGSFAGMNKRSDGIYMIVTSVFSNKPGKLFLQKTN